MISIGLNEVFSKAVTYAKENKHEYLTIEHIFWAILHSKEGKSILSNLGANIARLKHRIEAHLLKSIPKLEYSADPIETLALSKAVNDMINHVHSAGKKEADIADMLVSIASQSKSYAQYLLSKEGIDRLTLIEYISHPFEDSDDIKVKKDDKKKSFPNLENYTVELVELAKNGKIDPVIGRENEIERLMQILCRRKKNNPILVGEPGVGKTAIVEGLALKIASGDIPNVLKNAKIYSLDMGSLLAGTKYRGDFEKRIKDLLVELKEQDDAILFIDEIHTLIGAGSTSGGSLDASNLLKPALARGEIKCIGATTHKEFRNFFDKDKALSRRFGKVDIKEPSIEDTFLILKGVQQKYEEHHKIKFSDEALKEAIDLSIKYMHGKFLPDKAMDLIDDAGAHYLLKEESDRVVDANDIKDIVAKMFNLPTQKVQESSVDRLKNLEDELKKAIVGQDKAIKELIKAIKRSYAGLNRPDTPIGSFLFMGPTGVGKSALAKELADKLGIHFERLDMSEYMEKHAVSRLIGAPPGYVGYEQGGILTEIIKKHPHTLLLLDEIEKAHPDIMNILLQVMDGAKLTDNNGEVSDFKNVILVMTSNLGTKEANVVGFQKDESIKSHNALKGFFSAEFRNRLSGVIEFNPLSLELIEKIVYIEIDKLNKQLKSKDIEILIDDKVAKYIAKKAYSKEFGAREISRVIDEEIKERLSDEILFGKLNKGGRVKATLRKDKISFKFEDSSEEKK
ncbi:MAG: ATP-dependent Clp protease ATP-binding subunit ClpA [Epsilonproteobacteria bacterium]|nr:ATP-dependent Clp protease ATP-binding subunit ClpA [Campylobacterota bacterium]